MTPLARFCPTSGSGVYGPDEEEQKGPVVCVFLVSARNGLVRYLRTSFCTKTPWCLQEFRQNGCDFTFCFPCTRDQGSLGTKDYKGNLYLRRKLRDFVVIILVLKYTYLMMT